MDAKLLNSSKTTPPAPPNVTGPYSEFMNDLFDKLGLGEVYKITFPTW
jgi:hypothetical protein